MIGLIDTAEIRTRGTSSGAFDEVLEAALPCRLAHMPSGASGSPSERAGMLARRNLIWGPDFVMPEACRIVVEGITWQPVSGTFEAYSGPQDTLVYRRCDCSRVD